MTGLVIELQRQATDPSARVTELLRKALIVATKLQIPEFREWAQRELNGYPTGEVPEYRNLQGEVKVRNPYRGWIPVMFEDPELQEQLSLSGVHQSVGEIENLVADARGHGFLTQSFPPRTERQLMADPHMARLGMVPKLVISPTQLSAVIEAVRNIVLEWSLRLERDGIRGDGMTFSQEEQRKAASQTYNITTFTGVLGDVHGGSVQIGDYASIHEQLKQAGISQSERNEVENILEAMKKTTGKTKESWAAKGVEWVTRNAPALGTLSHAILEWFRPHVGTSGH
jgi:hypothetical protein